MRRWQGGHDRIDPPTRRVVAAIQPCANEKLHVRNSATNIGFKRFRHGWVVTNSAAQSGDSMVRQLNHHDPFNFLLRANRAVMLAVLWVALAACVAGSVIYDVADWIGAW
jgi:hypothetical protein